MPITWRNVNGPDFSGLSEALGLAGESFTKGVDAIRQGKDTFEKGRTDRNTQAFMEQLSRFGSPEELAAAQESGQIANMRSEFGNLIDRDQTDFDAITDRVTGLRKEQTANRKYDASEKAFGNRDALNRFKEAIAARDSEGAQAIKDNNDFANGGQLQQQITGVADYRANEDIKDQDRRFALEKRNITREQWQREDDARQRTEGINTAINDQLSGQESVDTQMGIGFQETAKQFGLSIGKGGEVVYKGADPEKIRKFDAAVKRRGIGVSSDTQTADQLVQSLTEQFPDMNQIERASVKAEYYAGRTKQLAPRETSKLNKEIERAGKAFDIKNNVWRGTNQDVGSPLDVASTMVDELTQEGSNFTNNRDKVEDFIADYVAAGSTKGIDVFNDGNFIKVPPKLIKMAAQSVGDDLFEIDTEFDEALRNLVETTDLVAAKQRFDGYNEVVDGLNASALRNAGIGGGTADRNDRLASTMSMLERSMARSTAKAAAKRENLEAIESNSNEPISNEEAVSRADRLKRAGATSNQSMAIPVFPRPRT